MKDTMEHSGLTSMEKHGLHQLLTLLTRVKANGWSDAFTNHSREQDSDRSRSNESGESSPPYSEPLLSLRRAMEESRVCLEALNKVQERLKQRLRALRRVSMPLVLEDGIKRLPDDLLVEIFEVGHLIKTPGDSPFFSSIHVSHVCRLFRHIALQTPSLWTTIHEAYGDSQIREFISRSGELDLEVKILKPTKPIRSFLTAMKDTSHRWSNFCVTDMKETKWYTLEYDLRMNEFLVPNLSHLHVEGYGWLFTARSASFLSQLTHVELRLSEKDEIFRYDAIEGLAQALHRLHNLKDLSINMRHCTLKNEMRSSLFNKKPYPKPNCLPIDRLSISILGNEQEFLALLFDMALMHLRPSMVELSIDSMTPKNFLFNSQQELLFPVASTIKLHIPQTIDVMTTLANLLQKCETVKMVHFDTPRATGLFGRREHQLGDDDWERIQSLDHLRFKNCDSWTESEVDALTRKLLQSGVAQKGLLSLGIISCKKISEDFLLGLREEVGDRLKYSL